MKKILLAGTALLGTALFATAAHAELKLDLGGYFRGYAVYSESSGDSALFGAAFKKFDFRRNTEIHFTGETTLDNGLTVGFHDEMVLGNVNGAGSVPSGDVTQTTDEVYAYFSGAWGRINFGVEDGAAYLLQVAAPSADSNVDGLRTYIQALNVAGASETVRFMPGQDATPLDYDNAPFRQTDRITYLTPKFNGFQAGISYAPEPGENDITNNIAGQQTDDDAGDFKNLWEASARWDGMWQGFGISLGGGYSYASTEADSGANSVGSDAYKAWDAGLDVSFSGFSLGAAYLDSNNATDGPVYGDTKTFVVGTAWDNGPYHLGASYLRANVDGAGFSFAGGGAGADIGTYRYTVGGGYTFGPGMTFRGAVAFGNSDAGTAVTDQDFTQVTIGTDIQF